MLTTKAAVCPYCGKYHLIATNTSFEKHESVRAEFERFKSDNYLIKEVTKKEARDNFAVDCGGDKKIDSKQLKLF